MNFAKKVATYLGFVVLAAILISVLAPKATHALVATLVQVSNTPSSPVPNKDVDSAAHATVVPLGCLANPQPFNGGVECTLGFGGGSPYTVPAGQRLVIEQMSAFCQSSPNGGIPFIEFSLTEAGTQAVVPLALTSNQNFEFVTQGVRYYADPGTTIASTAAGDAATFCNFYANGYLVSYP
jgi:hypothetical protein